MTHFGGNGTMRISFNKGRWEKYTGPIDHTDWGPDWSGSELELERGLPLHSGRALTWLAVGQAVIQVSGLLFIIYACLR